MKKVCSVAVLLAVIASCDRGAEKPKTPKADRDGLKKLLVQ